MPGAFLFDGPADARATVLLAHGAGAPMDSASMAAVAAALGGAGLRVARFEFGYMARRRDAEGRQPPPRAETLRPEYLAAIASLDAEGPLIIGGKSMGGRIATHIAAQGLDGVSGIVLLGYPLHPPGAPEKRRDAHLPDITQPVLFVQGANDPFGNEHEIAALLPMMQKGTLRVIATGDHSLKVKGGATAQQPAFDDAMDTVVGWIRGIA